jgi:hypothetical protein
MYLSQVTHSCFQSVIPGRGKAHLTQSIADDIRLNGAFGCWLGCNQRERPLQAYQSPRQCHTCEQRRGSFSSSELSIGVNAVRTNRPCVMGRSRPVRMSTDDRVIDHQVSESFQWRYRSTSDDTRVGVLGLTLVAAPTGTGPICFWCPALPRS